MIKNRTRYQQVTFRIILGFAACSMFLFALAHPQIAYLGLLALSAFFRQQSVHRIEHWLRRYKPIKVFASVGMLAVLANLATGTAASAQWAGAKSAADSALSAYIGADVVTLLFTVVFLLLFFLIIGGLMTWGYKAFRNEDAAVPMTAFIVGTVIFVGGEVFSKLFFGGAATTTTTTPGT
ncbi:MAG: hypothetical protein AAGE59_04185 [Cyanobacteria bacterium P01_F01_bin.86]